MADVYRLPAGPHGHGCDDLVGATVPQADEHGARVGRIVGLSEDIVAHHDDSVGGDDPTVGKIKEGALGLSAGKPPRIGGWRLGRPPAIFLDRSGNGVELGDETQQLASSRRVRSENDPGHGQACDVALSFVRAADGAPSSALRIVTVSM